MNNVNEKKVIYYMFTFLVSVIYIYIISTFPNEWFRDRDNYIYYANNASLIIDNRNDGISFIFNEPIFLYLAKLFDNLSLQEQFPIAMSVFTSAVFLFILSKYSKTFFMFSLGVFSLIVVSYLQTAQLMVVRQGFATAIFILGFMLLKNDRIKLILCFFLSFVHSVFFIITFIYALYIFVLKNKNTNFIIGVTTLASSIFYIASSQLISILGFRQAELYANQQNEYGGGAFLLSLIILIYICIYGNKQNKDLYNWSIIGIVLFLVGYFLFFSPGRLFVSFYPFVLILLVTKSRIQDILFLMIVNIIYLILLINGSYMIFTEYTSSTYFIEKVYHHFHYILRQF